MKVNDTYVIKSTGDKVFILDIDRDKRCDVLVVFCNDCDRDQFVPRRDLRKV